MKIEIWGEFTPINCLWSYELRRNYYAGIFWREVARAMRLREITEWLNNWLIK